MLFMLSYQLTITTEYKHQWHNLMQGYSLKELSWCLKVEKLPKD